jgi:hypothetical protein
MNTSSLSSEEIVIRLREIHSARRAFDVEESELLDQLQKIKSTPNKPVLLTFGKNVITWGNDSALVIKGKGYQMLKALYYADKMRLKESTLDKLIWEGRVKHEAFVEYVRRLAEKLEREKFPYRLLPARSQPKVRPTGDIRKGKPILHFVPSGIIGVKLCPTGFGGIACGK